MGIQKIDNQIKAKIFALYLGNNYKRFGNCITNLSNLIEQVTGNTIQVIKDGEKGDVNYQLLLTPLSEITDEDAIQVARLCERHNSLFKEADWPFCGHAIINYHFFDKMIWQQHEEYKNSANMIGTVINCFQNHSERVILLADFLRSRGYMLPYMGIDLFESSLAIPKQ